MRPECHLVEGSPDLGIVLKSRFERMSTHYLGVGTRETELVSYDLKR